MLLQLDDLHERSTDVQGIGSGNEEGGGGERSVVIETIGKKRCLHKPLQELEGDFFQPDYLLIAAVLPLGHSTISLFPLVCFKKREKN